jgi:hypothetical protein
LEHVGPVIFALFNWQPWQVHVLFAPVIFRLERLAGWRDEEHLGHLQMGRTNDRSRALPTKSAAICAVRCTWSPSRTPNIRSRDADLSRPRAITGGATGNETPTLPATAQLLRERIQNERFDDELRRLVERLTDEADTRQ